MTVGSYSPNGVENAAFHRSSFLIWMLLYPQRMSSLVKYVEVLVIRLRYGDFWVNLLLGLVAVKLIKVFGKLDLVDFEHDIVVFFVRFGQRNSIFVVIVEITPLLIVIVSNDD